ncbi:MAG: hypothetical protein HYR94_23825 [Chloroflexi bacterium]|nr:hypothetical protein [Chloroflexota bacterium]
MTDPTTFYQRTYQNLLILKQREAQYGGRDKTPPELLKQIGDHEKAIFLTRQYLDSLISEADWRTALKSLRLSDVSTEPATLEDTSATQMINPSGENVALMIGDYHLGNIRILLTKSFSDTELRDFCFDQLEFREVYEQLAQNTGKKEIVRLIMEYADQNLLFDQLLAWTRERNPARYKRHQPYIIQG